jgi:hypothetical protein
MQNSSIQVNGTIPVSLVRKASMLEPKGSITMFPCENYLNFLKEYCFPLSLFMCEEHQI